MSDEQTCASEHQDHSHGGHGEQGQGNEGQTQGHEDKTTTIDVHLEGDVNLDGEIVITEDYGTVDGDGDGGDGGDGDGDDDNKATLELNEREDNSAVGVLTLAGFPANADVAIDWADGTKQDTVTVDEDGAGEIEHDYSKAQPHDYTIAAYYAKSDDSDDEAKVELLFDLTMTEDGQLSVGHSGGDSGDDGDGDGGDGDNEPIVNVAPKDGNDAIATAEWLNFTPGRTDVDWGVETKDGLPAVTKSETREDGTGSAEFDYSKTTPAGQVHDVIITVTSADGEQSATAEFEIITGS